MSGPRVLLIGMMGAGKTTVGRLLAARTGWPYLDNDELVARASGRLTADVLVLQGVARLRRVESAALTEALSAAPPVIAAVAGGVVDDDADRRRLRDGGYVVWLRARLQTLAGRVAAGPPRPWLGADPLAELSELYAGRADRYAETATLIIDVDELPAPAVVDRILTGLRAAGELEGE